MPAKRKAAAAKKETVKEPEPVSRRSTRGTSAVADKSATGTKRKASPSPTPATKKATSAKRGRTRSPSPAPNNRPSRGRVTVAKKEEAKPEAKTPSRSASSQKGRVTRNVVQEVEEKKSTEKTRSSSRGAKTPVLPKEPVTPKQKAETPKPRAGAARGRSATPKQNKTTPKQVTVTPKQKSATPKQKPIPKQKQQMPKMQKSPPATKKATPKSTPKKKTKPDPPPRSSRSRRSKEVEAAGEESEEDADVNDKEQTEEESPVPNATTDGEDMEVATENTEKVDNINADKEAEVEDKAVNEEKEDDNTEEQDKARSLHVVSKTEEADKLEDMSEETEIEKQAEEAGEEPAVTEDADKEQKIEGDDDDGVEDPKEEDEGVSEKAEDTKTVKDIVKEDEPEEEKDHEVENNVADSSEKKENDVEEDEEPAEDESEKGDKSVTVVEEAIEIDEDDESEQVDSDEKEIKSAEIEESNVNESEESEVENNQPAEDSSVPEQSDAKVGEKKNEVPTEETSIELDENDSNDGVEIISESSEKPEQDVIDLNDDSGDAVIIEEEPAVVNDLTIVDDVKQGSGDQEQSKSVASVEEISDDDIEEIDTKQNNVQGNGAGDDDNDDIEVIEFVEQVDKCVENVPTKRKFGDVESEEIDDSSPAKKVRMSTEEEIQENGAGSQEDVAEDYVVIEMSDVPQATSTEVQGSLPNPIFNRSFIPNPTFSGSLDSSKQFSVVTYNVLADCHLFRNDYSFTEAKYLEPDYRLKKIIEEVRYLDGDVVCMQEVDPQFFQQQLLPIMRTAGYEGVHKKRTDDYHNEGEATFYRNSRFELVESESSTLQHLLKKELVDGIEPAIQDAVKKYMSLPDVVIVTKLKCKSTGNEVTVGNVHIQWGEMKVPDAQCVQIASAVKEIVSMATGDNFPHIICGDFNSPPLSPGYLVARDGYPSGDDTINTLMKIEGLQLPEGKKASLVNSLWPAFQHTSSSLRSAYSEAQGYEPEVSSYNCVMCHCVDYIFYSSTSLENVGVLQTASKEKITETGGIPNCYFPSDHISLKSVLSFK